jgi:hypothetical protein
MKILGCDPGIRGALALIEIDEFDLHVIDTIDIPTIGTKAKERVNVHAVQEWILQHGPQFGFIERGQAMPRQGASSGYKFGRSVGARGSDRAMQHSAGDHRAEHVEARVALARAG